MKKLLGAMLATLLFLPGLAHAKIFLIDTNDTLRVVTASGISTIHMYAAWADLTTTTLTPGASDAQVTTATTTVLVAAPGASTQRQIKGLSIRNAHASSSNVITVEFFDGATATQLISYTLLAGETLQWGEDENFRVIDANGQIKGSIAANDGIIKDGTGDTTQANVISGRLQVENFNANLAADNSTVSTSKVPVLPGTVSTSAPTWTNGNQSALSLQTDGSVRAAVTNSVTIGSGTVTANAGTNLNTSALLTTTAHDAAFGTAGTPDAQVRSMQGIAGGTPVGVQSNGANLATETTLAAVLTALQLIDDDQTGATMAHRISVGTTEDEHEIKGSAGRLLSINVTNTNAAVRYLRCANQVIGSTTPGTTTVWYGMAIPGSTTGGGYTATFGPTGAAFSTGLTCWMVTGSAETDVTEVAANEINVNYTFK